MELAAALKSLGVKVTVLVRTDRLMSKQLDKMAAEILKEEIEKRDIEILFNSEIAKVNGFGRVTHVELKDGKKYLRTESYMQWEQAPISFWQTDLDWIWEKESK